VPTSERKVYAGGSIPLQAEATQSILEGTRIWALAGRVLRYAVATGRAQHHVAADLKDALAPVKSKNFASMTDPVRLGELMRAIYGYTGHPVTALALKLAPRNGPSLTCRMPNGASRELE
jgi:hypothetical protein